MDKIRQVAPSQARGLKLTFTPIIFRPLCRAFTGAWIETSMASGYAVPLWVAPSQARGLKPVYNVPSFSVAAVAPSQARGLKR